MKKLLGIIVLGLLFQYMPLTITQSNKKDYISRDFIFNTRKDKIVFGIGKNFEVDIKRKNTNITKNRDGT